MLGKRYNYLISEIHSRWERDWGLPWWLSGKELACQCRRFRFDSWSGKISHDSGQLSLCATTIEPVLWSPVSATTEPRSRGFWSLSALELMLATREAAAVRSLHTAAREKARAATRTQHSRKQVSKQHYFKKWYTWTYKKIYQKKRLIILYKVRNSVPQSLHEKTEKIRSGKIPSSLIPNAD